MITFENILKRHLSDSLDTIPTETLHGIINAAEEYARLTASVPENLSYYISQANALQFEKKKLESLLESAEERVKIWQKQYYEVKQKLDLNIAITGNEYSLKP